jgi:hypothetical protein
MKPMNTGPSDDRGPFNLAVSLRTLAIVQSWLGLVLAGELRSEDRLLHTFDCQQLTDVYYSEGANAGDLDQDGKPDIIYGPYWFRGTDFQTKHEIYPVVAQPREAYADNFFSWVHDFNADGWNDVFVVGFPGTAAYVYENPGVEGHKSHWPRHQVFDWVSNESPHFTNIVGDERPELVCTRDGFFGYATINWDKPFEAWAFHKASDRIATPRFGHGLGVGDVDGDSRPDILMKDGWLRQPESLAGGSSWKLHPAEFSPSGGAEMHAYDVDGDGDNDIITSLAAHEFGLAWFEQRRTGDEIVFDRHLIMGELPEQNRYGVLFSELHSVNLWDMDGDGLKDIVTGKTYWSHHTQSPMWDAGAVVYWFRLVRSGKKVDWIPHRAATESGIGRQVSVVDISGDNRPDIVVGGMKGAHVLIQKVASVDEASWLAAQPKPIASYQEPVLKTVGGSGQSAP